MWEFVDAYRWILGGVLVNHHSLSDFRVQHGEFLDGVLTQSVAVLMERGLVTLKRVSQDGIRVRANAGAASFRRQPSLERCLQEAQEQVESLRQELEHDPEATSRRQASARLRAVEDRKRRVKEALAQMPKVAAKKPAAEQEKARVSTTDAEARVMKMGDGGFRPSYNGQFAVDTESQIVVGVEVSNSGSDQGQLVSMIEQLQERYKVIPSESLVDGGFAGLKDVEKASELGTMVYAPVAKPKDKTRDPYVPLASDCPATAQWLAQAHRHARGQGDLQAAAATVECVNALARNRGLQRLLVRSGQGLDDSALVRHRPQSDADALVGCELRDVGLRSAPQRERALVPLAKPCFDTGLHVGGVSLTLKAGRKAPKNPAPPFDLRQQQQTPVRGQCPTVKGGHHRSTTHPLKSALSHIDGE